ncbi:MULTISPECIES: PilN domain-containing protein [Chromobacteriaceae]|uniref:Fimbrial protein n=3 Tax=Chromobacteriaceae TaxID=1499392 RepID=A0A1D9LGT4_9NEIS|nr:MULTISPECIES: PilN domain-containing protein [Chromobacteriaceae]AOZ50435.1 fimbrial protein [Chromobacterium vaccinii]AVG14653.1 fimbrial protein [Chromobacterium vaccinii]ERE02438.1 fimbrial protein [Pseudogulbenkiania ferrooxidans EGD-HP2]SUX54509.1 Fimbrial assembly protein (PilN) [Chromobacterium vaccinii]
MIRVNLLPHREQKKAAHRLRFQLLLGAAVLVSLVLLTIGYMVLQHQISEQEARNHVLQAEIGKLDRQIKDIGKLKKQRDDLLARKQLVERLQEGRNSAVHLFDQLVRQTPDGVYLRSFKQIGNQATLTGYAQSGARVSSYMRQLGQSETFDAPVLVEVSSIIVNNQRVSAFTLNATMKQSLPSNKPAGATP